MTSPRRGFVRGRAVARDFLATGNNETCTAGDPRDSRGTCLAAMGNPSNIEIDGSPGRASVLALVPRCLSGFARRSSGTSVKGGFSVALDTAELVAGAIGRAGENMAECDHVWRPRSCYPLFEKRVGT